MDRDYLKDVNIWGAILVSMEGKILHYTIPCLLKYCDKVLIVFDNENEETKDIVLDYKKNYENRIVVGYSGIKRATKAQEEALRGLFRRFKPIQGKVRDTVLQYFRDMVKNGEKVDIIVWPDGDEVFTKELPDVLKTFWSMKDKLGVTIRPITVFGDMKTISRITMAGHTRIFKFFPELTAIPTSGFCHHRPLTKLTRLNAIKITVHLMLLTKEKIKWRMEHWVDRTPIEKEMLWKIPRDVMDMTFKEMDDILKQKPDLTVKEYLKSNKII